MLQHVYGHDEIIAQFVAALIPSCRERGFGRCRAIGVVEGGLLIAGFVYHEYNPDAQTIQISGASLPGHHWCTQETLAHIYRYPFLQLDCQMITQVVPLDNVRLLHQLSRLNYDFIMFPRMFGRERDGVICNLTREAWEVNKICRRYRHHISQSAFKEAAE